MLEHKTDSLGVAHKYGYQSAANGDEMKPPYKEQDKNDAWIEGYKEACEDFDIK